MNRFKPTPHLQALGFGMIVNAFCGSILIAQTPFPEAPEDGTTDHFTAHPSLEPIPTAPEYSDRDSWALLFVEDQPDFRTVMPKGRTSRSLKEPQVELQADVFFIHPTMLMEGLEWNADLEDASMNQKVDRWPIRHQASAFAGVGRIFAPRYRQAHIRIFDLGDSLSWAAAEVAYSDVRAAFLHYLEHWNEGRPILLAGHSQGSFHGRTLLQEFFDGTPLQSQLIAAYFPGMDMYADEFDALTLCGSPEDTGCLCTWMTYGEGYLPPWITSQASTRHSGPVLCVNPVTWTTEPGSTHRDAHLGVVRPSFRLSKPRAITAEIRPEGVLWIPEPHVLGGRWLQRDNWHSGDINLFWVNVYQNAQHRAESWHQRQGLKSE